MGDGDLETTECSFADARRDCDRDWDNYCTKSGDCPYQDWKRDCDGDYIVFCRA